jgi:hypothetical protein
LLQEKSSKNKLTMAILSTLRNNPNFRSSNKTSIQTRTLDNLWTPAIPFSPTNKRNQPSNDDDDDDKVHTLKMLLPLGNPTNEAQVNAALKNKHQAVEIYVKLFSNGSPEEWCNWRESLDRICRARKYDNNPSQRLNIARMMLEGPALEYFNQYLGEWINHFIQEGHDEDDPQPVGLDELTPEEQVKVERRTINSVALKFFDGGAQAYRLQKRYMKNNLKMSKKSNPRDFADRIKRMGNLLKYFPVKDEMADETPTQVPMNQEELVDCMDTAKPGHWHIKMLDQSVSPEVFEDIDKYVEYLQRFYRAEGYEDKYLQLGKNGGQKKRGREGDDNGRSKNGRPTKRTKKWKRNPAVDACKVCGKNHKGRCWLLDKEKESIKPNGDKKNSWKDRRNKASYQIKGKESANTVTLTKQELFKLVEKANGVQTSKAHKEPSSDSEESYEANNHIHMMEKGESVWDTDEEVNESSDSEKQ